MLLLGVGSNCVLDSEDQESHALVTIDPNGNFLIAVNAAFAGRPAVRVHVDGDLHDFFHRPA